MSQVAENIDRLFSKLNHLYCNFETEAAKIIAEELAALLGTPTPESISRYVYAWELIWEVRGNIEEAIRIADLDIDRKRGEIESGDYDPYPEMLPEEVGYLRDAIYLQAERYNELGNSQKAIEYLNAGLALTARYGIQPDNDTQLLLAKLTSPL